MTGNENGEGVRAHSAGKRRYWLYNAMWIAAFLALGVAMRQFSEGQGPGSLTAGAGIGFSAALVIVFAVGCLAMFRVVDELDRQDNYIAGTVGFLTNVILVIGWMPLYLAGLTGTPSGVICLFVSALVTVAVYLWLKLRNR